ncbi:hypothetical protein [Fontimonas thermophila]|uniref:hypothetical protein n=1 Tax=Fontimonas thermophila TaxID=1076937 RepID=UPI000B8290DF|nr:hypothetical protein [Fontimonas thermophila]
MALALVAGSAHAAPYRPANDDEILERLPPRAAPAPRAAVPDAALAARAARVFIERARRSDDPRDYGYAQGLLQPWWSAPDAPDEILLLRATLQQHQHAFDAALADLDRVLERSPDKAQAWLTRATIHRVRGALDAAAADCERLRTVAPGVVAELCRLAAAAPRDPQGAGAALDALAAAAATQPDPIYAWYQAERAAAAQRRGDLAAAEAAFTAGLARAPWDIGLRAAYADLLLDSGRAAAAAALLDGAAASDTLRLRALLADRALGNEARAAELTAALADAYAALRRRGDAPHLREEALFELKVRADAARALTLAQANWRDQRELADARLLLAAAQAAGDARAIAGLRDWCAANGVRDAWLETRW